MSSTPVLFTVFNRLNTTKKVFEAIRAYQPTRLYIASDGPRPDQANEAEEVERIRQFILDHVDWPCEVHTLFQEKNLGLRQAISGALDWFFTHEEAGIILEDDCVPQPSFFTFCTELLERYKHDTRVMAISGDNFQPTTPYPEAYSYYFSRYFHVWGWATWRRAWAHYDRDMALWPIMQEEALLSQIFEEKREVTYWNNTFNRVYAGKLRTWDYIAVYSFWLQGGLTITPQVNLVTNIGLGENATNTKRHRLVGLETVPILLPLTHPPYVIRDKKADVYSRKHVFNILPFYQRVWRYLKRSGEAIFARKF